MSNPIPQPEKKNPQPEPQAEAPKLLADCKGVTPEMRAAVTKQYGKVRILAVGPHSIIVHDGNPKQAGRRVPNPLA